VYIQTVKVEGSHQIGIVTNICRKNAVVRVADSITESEAVMNSEVPDNALC